MVERPRYTTETARAVAARFGGKFIDPEFKGIKHRHNWETRDGMPFKRSLASILTYKTFLPNDSTYERLCRNVFQSLFNDVFPKTRLALVSDDPNEPRLELDGYSKRCRLAFEYQGRQHYEHIPYFHTALEFEALKQNDAKKRQLCEQRGIRLIEIPYTLTSVAAIKGLVLDRCKELSILVASPSATVSVESASTLSELQALSAQHDQLEVLQVRAPQALVRCKKHPDLERWVRIPTVRQALRRGSGCEACRMEKLKANDPRIKRIEAYRELARKCGVEFLDPDVPGTTNMLGSWTCSNCGKPYSTQFVRVKAGHTRCKSCTKKVRISINSMHAWAQAHFGRCLTKVLDKGGKTRVKFRDEDGDHFERSASFVVNDGTWPTDRKKPQRHDLTYVERLLSSHRCEFAEDKPEYRSNSRPLRVRCVKGRHAFETTLRELQRASTANIFCDTCQLLARLD